MDGRPHPRGILTLFTIFVNSIFSDSAGGGILKGPQLRIIPCYPFSSKYLHPIRTVQFQYMLFRYHPAMVVNNL